MSAARVFAEAEAHRHFAIQYNGQTWDLLEKPDRDDALKYIELAARAGEAIADEQSKQIFSADLNAGEWAGLK